VIDRFKYIKIDLYKFTVSYVVSAIIEFQYIRVGAALPLSSVLQKLNRYDENTYHLYRRLIAFRHQIGIEVKN
jgi:hypothetical protein